MPRTSQRVQFPGHEGNLLAGIMELPEGSPRGFILFSHCFTCNKDLKAIVRISRTLADRGWGVLRYDFTGLGNSEGDFRQTNFTTNREDLRAAARYLANDYQRADFLIGHSFGGAASMSLANELDVQGVITIASPSDTHHLATLLLRMDPNIETHGQGSVTIGGRTYTILRQMVKDFRSHDLRAMVDEMTKPLLAFHSPSDETVDFRHAIVNCGFEKSPTHPISPLESPPLVAQSHLPSPQMQRSLISIPNSNHLLTSNDDDCNYVAEITDAWCQRLMLLKP